MRAATGSQCNEMKRGVTWVLLGSLKTSRATAFWIICRGLIVLMKSSKKSIAVVQPRNDKGLDKKLCSRLCQKGPDFFWCWCSANLQDRAVFACALEGQLVIKDYTKISDRSDGVIIDVPNWIEKSCCRVGVAGTTRSSVFARLSCRWCSFIHAEMSARAAWDPCSYRWIICCKER